MSNTSTPMEKSDQSALLVQTQSRIETIVNAVLERGYDECLVYCDDYFVLLNNYEFRQLIIFEIYDVYFPPKRHEFDLQLISEFVNGVLASRQAEFIIGTATSGIIGSVTYDILKSVLSHLVNKFRGNNSLQEPFQEINENARKITEFFSNHEEATIRELSDYIGTDEEKLTPLLKLLGYKCKRRKKGSIWLRK